MTGSSPGDAHVWAYCRNGCTDGTASNQKLLKLQLNTQDWIQRGWGEVTGRGKGYYVSEDSNYFFRKEQVRLCLLASWPMLQQHECVSDR